MKNVSVVMTCFNEGRRMIPIIDEIEKSQMVREIVVVDDGSEKQSAEVLDGLTNRVRLYRHKKNQGKARGMKTGLMKAKGEVVVFVDADLKGFEVKHLEKLVKPVLGGKKRMAIGVREKDVFYARLIPFATAYGGERAFNRAELLSNLQLFEGGGYLIEADFNKYYLNNGEISKIWLDGVSQTAKVKKSGLVGLYKSLKMLWQIGSHLGWGEFWKQMSVINKLSFYDGD